MRSLNLWKITVGRSSLVEICVSARSIMDAIYLGVQWIKEEHPEWLEVGPDDIRAVSAIPYVAYVAEIPTGPKAS